MSRSNWFYLGLMFVLIAAVGACGIYALMLDQRAAVTSAIGDTHTADARQLVTAIDLEQEQLLVETPSRPGVRARMFRAANAKFEDSLGDLEHSAVPTQARFVRALRRLHDRYVVDGLAVVVRFERGDPAGAERLEGRMHPNVESIRRQLAALYTQASAENEAADIVQRRGTSRLEQIIAVITILALAAMAGIATLFGRQARAAVKAAAEKLALEQAALTDNLTMLGNHRAFSEDFEREVARARRNGRPLVLALIDVDDFKSINDSRGHAHGDVVLAAVGTLLRTLRQEDRAYRVGGDEFAVLLVETDPAGAQFVMTHLRHQTASLSGATLSIGYVNLRDDQFDLEPYERADAALYEAKRRGRNTTVCFDEISESANVFSPRKAELVRRMIAGELLSVAFQPIWDIESTQPLGFEALARPALDLGLSGPTEAFDIAERIRQVYELDALCIRKALAAASNLPAGSTIFLNVAPASFANPRFSPGAFVAQLHAAGISPRNVVIELTERRIDDQIVIIDRARALQAMGVRMALDDTGSGHAGLELLSKLRLDFVKIDRTLLVKALEDQGARGVLAGIIAIARETGSYLIAEGVESGKLLDFACKAHAPGTLTSARIRGVQGFLLGRPELGKVDARALEDHHAYLRSHTQHDDRAIGTLAAV